jgi:hypothetical protein
MKTRVKEDCGSAAPNDEKSAAQTTLETQGEIFSCGGVYLSPIRDTPLRRESLQYLHLPNRGKEVVMLKNQKVMRWKDNGEDSHKPSFQEAPISTDTIRRFFKEGLN